MRYTIKIITLFNTHAKKSAENTNARVSTERSDHRRPTALACSVVMLCMLNPPAHCQSLPGASDTTRTRTLSGEVINGSASGGSQEGHGVALRFTERISTDLSDGVRPTRHERINSLEWRRQNRLNETGQQLAAQQTSSIGDGRHLTVGLNVSDSFLFPRWGLTGVLEQPWNNPWLRSSRVGLSHQTLKNDQKQTALLLEQTGQFNAHTIWQVGRQQGIASPGNRSFHANHVSIQYVGPDRWRALVRRQWSREASALLVDGSNAQGFNSQAMRASIGLEWLPGGWISLFHDRYKTPFYERQQTGVSVEQSW